MKIVSVEPANLHVIHADAPDMPCIIHNQSLSPWQTYEKLVRESRAS